MEDTKLCVALWLGVRQMPDIQKQFSFSIFSSCIFCMACTFHYVHSATSSLTDFVFEIRVYKCRGSEQLADLVFGSIDF